MSDRFINMFSDENCLCDYLEYYLDNNFVSTILLISSCIIESKGLLYHLKDRIPDSYITKNLEYDIFKNKQNIIFGTGVYNARSLSKGSLLDGIIVYRPQIIPYKVIEEIYAMKNNPSAIEYKIPCED